jgi:hypothetical protein
LKSSVVAMLYTRGHRDMAAFTVDQDAYAAPGQVFRYSSGDSGLLSRAEGHRRSGPRRLSVDRAV